uniref:hypothetical protein n=1 Tax=uncultured Erythrobacter sp. TaxID=263913 RepID=UPI002636978A|nr:hypothetical protein [uncultured Erythrobacter sp.]
MAKKEIGICKLTGNSGKFVKSHIIPRALTLPRSGGDGFAELGQRKRPKRRFDSWYDIALVTLAGENILTDYDTFAIGELRSLQLIWQSWGPMKKLAVTGFEQISGTPNGIRRVQFNDPKKMRLFFLSIFWRAAASDRPEFAEIRLSHSQMRRLRNAVRDQRTDLADNFFPIVLTQISTRGLTHNHGPISDTKMPVKIGKLTSKPLRIFRFYFDGLAFHVHLDADDEAVEGMRPMLVGPTAFTTLPTVTWEHSWQARNMADVLADAEHEFPGAASRADGRGNL